MKEVRYAIGSDQITREAFDELATQKYGPRATRMSGFCFPQEQACFERVRADSFYLPHILTGSARMSMRPSSGTFYHLVLEEGTLLTAKREKENNAALEAAAPRDAKPAF